MKYFGCPIPASNTHLFRENEDHAECLHWATAEGSRAEFRGVVLQGLRSSTLLWWHSYATWPYMGCLEIGRFVFGSPQETMRKDAGSFSSEPLRRLIGHSWPVGKIDLSIFIFEIEGQAQIGACHQFSSKIHDIYTRRKGMVLGICVFFLLSNYKMTIDLL